MAECLPLYLLVTIQTLAEGGIALPPLGKECGERKRGALVWGAAMGIAGHDRDAWRLPRLNKEPETWQSWAAM
jgi:hypothetical protein